MVAKLRKLKLHPKVIAVLVAWLQQRSARVVVGGMQSAAWILKNMVYQGTVLGPDLWNTFFEDARRAVNEVFFNECVFADDLNAWREFAYDCSDTTILECVDACQHELHTW